MAARKMTKPWAFYVYEVLNHIGTVLYVGKGSGRRMGVSQRERNGASAREVACFKREQDAYAFEIEHIATTCPCQNIARGGNGSKATAKQAPRKPAWVKEIERIGTQRFAAQLWLRSYKGCMAAGIDFPGDKSKVDRIRQVAHG